LRENDQPSKPPGIASRFVGPPVLYIQRPPFGAYQYDQNASGGGVSTQASW
jgi:hypothetical protein